jgi:hypothetical protein
VPENLRTYPFTARVLTHYDTLHVGSRAFADVLVVRYAAENSDHVALSQDVPYFVLYLSRGYGIAMVEKVRRDSVVSRQVVTSME